MPNYIDAHSHLYADEFSEDLESVITEAKETGVCAALVVTETKDDFSKVLTLAKSYEGFCLPCMGLHPVQGSPDGEARSVRPDDLEEALPLIEEYHEQLFAIGEVGLDFTPWYCKGDKDKENQRQVLRKFVELSKKFDLPLNVHSRSAGRPTIGLLKDAGAEKVLLHAFDGKASVAMTGVEAGYFFSIPPSVVRSEHKQKLIEKIPLENILLETDSPALGPEKEGRNVPSNIRLSCEFVAKIKKIDVETVAKVTWENTLRLFPKIGKYLKK